MGRAQDPRAQPQEGLCPTVRAGSGRAPALRGGRVRQAPAFLTNVRWLSGTDIHLLCVDLRTVCRRLALCFSFLNV